MTKRRPAFTCIRPQLNARGTNMKRVGVIDGEKTPDGGNAGGKKTEGTQTGSGTAGAPAGRNAGGK